MYNNVVHDPKVQRLPPTVFKGWVNLLCVASANGGNLPPIADIAYTLHLSIDKTAKLLLTIEKAGLIDRTNDECTPHNWQGRQFQSDGSTARVKAFRERKKSNVGNVSCNVSETVQETFLERAETVTVTPPDTDTETDTERTPPSVPPSGGKRKRGCRLEPEWQPDTDSWEFAVNMLGLPTAESELEKFRDHWKASSGANASKLDWLATWRNWCRRTRERRGAGHSGNGANPKGGNYDEFGLWRDG